MPRVPRKNEKPALIRKLLDSVPPSLEREILMFYLNGRSYGAIWKHYQGWVSTAYIMKVAAPYKRLRNWRDFTPERPIRDAINAALFQDDLANLLKEDQAAGAP